MNFTEADELWNKTMRELQKSIPSISYNTWIAPLKLHEADEKTVKLIISDTFKRNTLMMRYHSTIEEYVSGVFGKKLNVEFLTEDEIVKAPEPQMNTVNLNPKYTFENFVVGKSNQFAHAASLAVAEMPGEAYNPLFIHGGVGLGKTHLMNAIAHFVLEKDPGKKILFTTTESFVNEVIEAIAKKKTQEMRNRLRTVDVFIVDDVQFLSNKTATQEEFFHTFNALYENGKQIILSSDRPPHEIPTLEERLRSRFMSGLTVDIGSPDFETRIAILQSKAESDHIEVPYEVFELIAERVNTNIRELEGALNRVKAMANIMGTRITLEIAEQALQNLVEIRDNKRITAEMIIETIAEYFGISTADILSSKRNREITVPRQIGMYMVGELTDLSTTRIGMAFGGRDHTTVMHGRERVQESLQSDPSTKKAVEELKAILKNR